MLFFKPKLSFWVCQESRRRSSAARCCAPRSGTQRSPTQPGSILQRERGSESKRCPPHGWIQTGSYCSGDLWRICKYITRVQRISPCTRFCSGNRNILKISERLAKPFVMFSFLFTIRSASDQHVVVLVPAAFCSCRNDKRLQFWVQTPRVRIRAVCIARV